MRKVCTEPNCLIHHSKKKQTKGDSSLKVEQEKRRREEAIAATAGRRILAAIADAIPVRLMKRDLLFVAERLLPLLDDRRLLILGKGRSIRPKSDEAIGRVIRRLPLLSETTARPKAGGRRRSPSAPPCPRRHFRVVPAVRSILENGTCLNHSSWSSEG